MVRFSYFAAVARLALAVFAIMTVFGYLSFGSPRAS